MSLKYKISNSEFENLTPDIKSEYIQKDGGYVLDITGINDEVPSLTRARDKLISERDSLKTKNVELSEQLANVKPSSEWETEIANIRSEYDGKLTKSNEFIKETLIDSKALALASKISTKPNLILPHISKRLHVDFEGDKPITKIIGSDGKPSEMTIDQLEAELKSNPDFSPIIKASLSSGGKTSSSQHQSSKSFVNNDEKDEFVDLSKMKDSDLAARIKAKKESESENVD